MTRLLPHPALSLVITVVWIALINSMSLGSVVFGLLLGLVVPLLTSPYWPSRPVLRRPHKLIGYAAVVLWDIVVSNVQVAYWVLLRSNASLRAQFVVIPLDITSREAIVLLAGTITMTPGTVSADLSADGSAILVHCLHTTDPDEVVSRIKSRYERRLKEIFG
ncbi:multisubunit potassium/proton antiporter PhaE subunit [Rhodopseudomonas thermotolerans]|uniref:Multisubunit potassium/proton antiporter PhaE subunit n=2 Tax=Rhodopseudomonas TaxID=1073 RepID=A0A336JSB7_9BRAD|nr:MULTISPECIES: Na+/H+ antiporter subunit E [Rhodopseudomonas]RED28101.1 multisubunit potassium/proton antiporter PhaE subunit [Rhodopseudomonas pentothenatexigens]REF91355.1 multisubunit potassium/proton antiporter PhaE subunit [Rhodopseudomonas thermotolerans]SSW92687.1 multisubunit potassium/proton antiporter PhaE subunit [Rhodopseudomonas pentothenatexigens]